MPDYSKSVIYKLYDNTNGDTYYGSTCNKLRYRIRQHKYYASKRPCKSKSIILNDEWSYCVVEEFPCETKLQLHTRERWWIENNKCVNKVIPAQTKEELKIYHKNYREEHFEEIKIREKQYREEHKEQISKKKKIYEQEHQEELKIYRKEHKEDKKIYMKLYQQQKYVCECGAELTLCNKPRHIKTAKHIKLMSCLPCPPSSPQPSPP